MRAALNCFKFDSKIDLFRSICIFYNSPAIIPEKMEMAGKFLKRRLEEFEVLRAEIDSLTLVQKMFNDTNTKNAQ